MVHTPSPPTPPDPNVTAAAQTSTNLATAQANATMNNVNQVTPYGNLTYSQSGQNWIDDPNGQTYYRGANGQIVQNAPMINSGGGQTTQRTWVEGNGGGGSGGGGGNGGGHWETKTVNSPQTSSIDPSYTAIKGHYVPSFTATQTLSPQQQAILDQTQGANLNLGKLANEQSAKMLDYLKTPVDLSAGNINNYTNTHWMGGFNNQWDRSQASLDQKLADQGIKLGSEAYSNAGRDFTTQRQAGMDQYLGDMYNNAQQSILTQRNQPINEIGALLSGSQVVQPTYANTNKTNIPTTDYAGIVNQDFQNKMGVYNQQLANSNASMGGLFGLGSSILGGWAMSDRRLKNEINRIGELPSGLPIYEFNYVWGGNREVGVMADEVEAMMPWAVGEGPAGFKMVDYARIG